MLCPIHDIVDYNALLLRWPGYMSAKIEPLQKAGPLHGPSLKAYLFDAPQWNIRERRFYYTLYPVVEAPGVQAGPSKAFETINNDSESAVKIEHSIFTYWNVGFLRAQVEQYEQENVKVLNFDVRRVPNHTYIFSLKAKNYLGRELWSFDEVAERWGYGPEFLRFKLMMGHIGSSAFRHDPESPKLSRDIREIIARIPNEQISFDYSTDMEPYEQAWPLAWAYAARRSSRVVSAPSQKSDPSPVTEEPSPRFQSRRGHNLPDTTEKRQTGFDNRWKEQVGVVAAAIVFCYKRYAETDQPVTKKEYDDYLAKKGLEPLMVEADKMMREILPEYILNRGTEQKKKDK